MTYEGSLFPSPVNEVSHLGLAWWLCCQMSSGTKFLPLPRVWACPHDTRWLLEILPSDLHSKHMDGWKNKEQWTKSTCQVTFKASLWKLPHDTSVSTMGKNAHLPPALLPTETKVRRKVCVIQMTVTAPICTPLLAGVKRVPQNSVGS